MILREGLTKENFFNEMEQQFPNAMKLFCEWIDEYKKAVNWNERFDSESLGINEFNDLPYDMQVGIWIKFADDTLNRLFEQPEYSYSGDLEEDIKTVFNEINDLEEVDG